MSRVGAAFSLVKAAFSHGFGLTRSVLGAQAPREAAKALVSRYEAFTGVHELRGLHANVVGAQDKFVAAQEKRRLAGDRLLSIQLKLKAVHDEMQGTSKGDPGYLKMITEEHRLIVEEEALRQDFVLVEKREREYFSEMTAAVKLSHETERIYAEKNKYLYLVASLAGTIIGVLGSTVNNKIKMAEFKAMLQEERSGNKMWNFTVDDRPIKKKLKEVEDRVHAVTLNQQTILDSIKKNNAFTDSEFRIIKQLLSSDIDRHRQYTTVQVSEEGVTNLMKSAAFYGGIGLLVCFFLAKLAGS